MNFFLYEFITGGGLLREPEPPSGSLMAEGRAMISALAEDFSQLGTVSVMRDERLECFFPQEVAVTEVSRQAEESATFARLAAESDWTLIVAPEFDGILLGRVAAASGAAKRLLNCGAIAIEIAGDKQQTADLLAANRIATPTGIALKAPADLPADFPFPAVLKPIDGAGSLEVRRIATREECMATSFDKQRTWRLERFCPGTPASCAVLCGPGQSIALAACTQELADDRRFAYQGGSLPLDPPLDARARQLASRAVTALPDSLGLVGVDLVLGDAQDGSDDVVLEINPRLTTSYVGLRALATTNLAAAMLAVARGEEPRISWREDTVKFLADGTIVGA